MMLALRPFVTAMWISACVGYVGFHLTGAVVGAVAALIVTYSVRLV